MRFDNHKRAANLLVRERSQGADERFDKKISGPLVWKSRDDNSRMLSQREPSHVREIEVSSNKNAIFSRGQRKYSVVARTATPGITDVDCVTSE